MKKIILTISMIAFAFTAFTQEIGSTQSFNMSSSDDRSIIQEKNVQNEFMEEMLKRDGYFKFMNDYYPPAIERNYKIPEELSTFKFLGDRYFNDPEYYYYTANARKKSLL